MNRHLDRFLVAARAGLVLLLLALCGQAASAAPAPFERSLLRPRQLYREDLVGTWTMVWGGHHCAVTLSAAGDYTCVWSGTTYIGSWGIDHLGRFWITESARPSESDSWRSYAARLDPRTLSGRVEVGSSIEIRLLRSSPPGK